MADTKENFLSVNKKLISSSIEDGLNQCLPDVLECPVCLECMEPPIRVCRNGHNICSKCRPRLNNCPTCRRTILLTRNIALEALAEQCMEKCRNVEVGCDVKKTSVQDIIDHMEICPYRWVYHLQTVRFGKTSIQGTCSSVQTGWYLLSTFIQSIIMQMTASIAHLCVCMRKKIIQGVELHSILHVQLALSYLK